jgi:hypothetical protein
MVLKKAFFPVFPQCSGHTGSARHAFGTAVTCAKTPGKQGSTRIHDVALTKCFHSLDAAHAVRAVPANASGFVRNKASDELCVSAGGCTNEHFFVPAGETTR